jgi:hypothetical protein
MIISRLFLCFQILKIALAGLSFLGKARGEFQSASNKNGATSGNAIYKVDVLFFISQ